MIKQVIKARKEQNITQSELAKLLGITRSSVNAWEMGISVPSTQYLVELANTFHISTDYILGLDETSTINVSGLSNEDIELLYSIILHLKKNK